jgi:phage tail-like protein
MSDKGAGQEHFKANYIEVIRRIVPEYYEETEYNLFGAEEDLQYRVLGSILYLANNVSSLIGKPTTYNLQVSSFSSNDSYVPYFVPFNNLTDVSPTVYEEYILRPFGKTFASFTNKEQFSNFLLASALPHTRVNHVSNYFAQQFSSTVDPDITTVSGVSNALIDNLGWAYLQNTPGRIVDSGSVGVSSFLYSSIMENIYYGKRLKTSDGVRNLFKWMYHNAKGGNPAWTPIVNKFLPVPFNNVSSVYNPANGNPGNFYASGGQLVNALDTLVSVWVNEDDPNSLYFRDIVNASLLGLDVSRMENAGPMSKMLKALAYGFYDIQTSIRDVQYLLDIEECPEEFLQYLGRYLGWTFFSEDPDKWRDQLKQAIYLYKAKGTRQAISQAVNMVIPSSVYSPISPVSGLQELWESYIPNLLYYTLKTETTLGKDDDEYLSFRAKFNQAIAASGLPFRVRNYDNVNKDNNVRFVVDAVLELLNEKYGYMVIGGVPYKETPYWTSQVARGVAPGYTARGARLTIPPWEESRFYQNCQVGPNMDEFIQSVSSILSNSYADAGCGVPVSAAVNVATYISSSVSIKDVNGITEPGWGANNTFKFMTSSLNLPLNYKEVIATGDLESMSVFDYWNSKSSEVHSKFHASSIDFSAIGYTNLTKTKMGRKGIPTIVNIFRQFSPFHTLNKLFVGSGIYDDYWGTRYGPKNSANAEIPWSGIMDTQILNTIQSDMDQAISTTEASTFPGAWAAGGSFSGVGVFPSIWNPQGGRYLPSATLHSTKNTSPQAYFWSGGAVTVSGYGRKALIAARTAARRRDLKYKFIGWAQNRQGLNQPISTDWFGMSGGGLQPVLKNRGLNIPAFVPKGFNFSSQNFVDTSGSLSSVYSYYNSSSTPFFEFSASEFFPARGIPDFEPNTSSFNQLRDVFGSQILRAMTELFIKKGREDKRWLRFTDQGFENFKFGTGIQQLFNDYNNIFRRQLSCWIDQETQVDGNRFAGGFNIIAHVFGPLLFNHNFSIKGDIQKNLDKKAFPAVFGGSISSIHPDWSGVVTTPTVEQNNVYLNTQGNRVELTEGILDAGARGSYVNYLDSFEHPSETFQSNKTLLSGIEFVSTKVNSIVVWNNPSNPSYNIDLISASGLTFIQRAPTSDPLKAVRARFPLNGNLNYSYNGKFKFPPKDDSLASKSLSAIAGWQLQEVTRTPNINSAGYLSPFVTPQAFVVDTAGSAIPYVQLAGKGGYSGTPGVLGVMSGVLGTSHTPNLATFVNVTDRETPANLRPLTPADSYQISFEASGRSAANDKICYAVFNQTAQKHWVEPTGQWRDIETTYSSNLVNVMTSSVGSPDGWHLYKGTITPSATFLQSDNYQLIVAPGRKGIPGVASTQFRVRDIKIENREQGITNITAGRQGNKLFKDEQYLLGIDARVARTAAATSHPDEKLYIRIVTDPKPYVSNGWASFAKNWCYDWHAKSWTDSRTTPSEHQWQEFTFPGSSLEPTRHVIEFNTLNSRTPLKYHSLSNDGPMGGYFASAGPVHNDETVYYVEVSKPIPTGEFNGVTLLGVDIVNKRYNVYADDYTKKNFIDMFDFFDSLGINKSSRDARDSSGTYLLSGGSRSEYLEYWGGSHSSVGIYRFQENE